MKQFEYVEQILISLKEEVALMREMVIVQLEKAKHAFFDNDLDLAREIISREKRVDILELKIDGDVEEYIARYTPKAIDLRLVVSLKKINFALERIGDYAEGVARYVLENDADKLSPQQIEDLQLESKRLRVTVPFRQIPLVLPYAEDSIATSFSDFFHLSGSISRKSS